MQPPWIRYLRVNAELLDLFIDRTQIRNCCSQQQQTIKSLEVNGHRLD